jgi:hypothetical protein
MIVFFRCMACENRVADFFMNIWKNRKKVVSLQRRLDKV